VHRFPKTGQSPPVYDFKIDEIWTMFSWILYGSLQPYQILTYCLYYINDLCLHLRIYDWISLELRIWTHHHNDIIHSYLVGYQKLSWKNPQCSMLNHHLLRITSHDHSLHCIIKLGWSSLAYCQLVLVWILYGSIHSCSVQRLMITDCLPVLPVDINSTVVAIETCLL
jgi:hypothetical protein